MLLQILPGINAIRCTKNNTTISNTKENKSQPQDKEKKPMP
jgi:hypothetical protein